MGVMIEYLNLKRMTAMHANEIAQAVTGVVNGGRYLQDRKSVV